MKCLVFYMMVIAMSVILGCQVGCGGDDYSAEQALTEQDYADIEAETRQNLYKHADWTVRWEQSRKAHKRYMKLKNTYPNAALNAYIEYYNWMHYGHPLAIQAAILSVKMDLAGQSNIPDTLEMLNLELQIAKDNNSTKQHIAELEADILFWSELGKELEAEGEDPAAFIIAFEIAEALE
ncbi:hypothetical protein F4X88_18285 [Candidatus Poribacteria bacterium]|nr:hypothetical protein [Candidatus Poribacteria bacterium]MYA58236.1 hypothetical protein [Candidatus Poribacteria bacterium]